MKPIYGFSTDWGFFFLSRKYQQRLHFQIQLRPHLECWTRPHGKFNEYIHHILSCSSYIVSLHHIRSQSYKLLSLSLYRSNNTNREKCKFLHKHSSKILMNPFSSAIVFTIGFLNYTLTSQRLYPQLFQLYWQYQYGNVGCCFFITHIKRFRGHSDQNVLVLLFLYGSMHSPYPNSSCWLRNSLLTLMLFSYTPFVDSNENATPITPGWCKWNDNKSNNHTMHIRF